MLVLSKGTITTDFCQVAVERQYTAACPGIEGIPFGAAVIAALYRLRSAEDHLKPGFHATRAFNPAGEGVLLVLDNIQRLVYSVVGTVCRQITGLMEVQIIRFVLIKAYIIVNSGL